MTPIREVNTRYAFSTRKQSAYGTALADTDLTEAHPADGYETVKFEITKYDNADQANKGHEFPTEMNNNTCTSQLTQNFPGSSYILGWAFAFVNGKVTTVQPDNTNAPNTYEHTFTMMDIDDPAVGKQLPATTFVEYLGTGHHTKYRDMVVKSLKLSGQTEQQLMVNVEMIGSGHKESSSMSMPEFVQTSFLRFANVTFQWGATNISAPLKDFNFTHTNELAEKDGYHPGSGTLDAAPGSPQVRGRLLQTKRACEMSFKLLMETNDMEADSQANTERSITITAEGETTEVTFNHKLELQIPKAVLSAVQKGTEDGFYVYDCTVTMLWDPTISAPYKAIITNKTPDYLALPA